MSAERSRELREGSPRRVWLAGASGFCGRALVSALSGDPRYLLYPHIRPSSSRLERLSAEWASLGVSPVVEDWGSIEAPFQEASPDVIVSVIGVTKRQTKRGGGSYAEVDEGLNLRLIELAERHTPQAHMIYLSSQGAQWGRWSAYLRARMNVERALSASNLRATVLRPGLLSGESRDERRPLEERSAVISHALTRLLTALGLSRLADGVRPLDAPDVARLILSMMSSEATGDTPHVRVYELRELHVLRRALEA